MPELLLLGLIGLALTSIGIKYLIYRCDINVPLIEVEVPDIDNEIPPKYEDIVIN